jgi:hypothetical protein
VKYPYTPMPTAARISTTINQSGARTNARIVGIQGFRDLGSGILRVSWYDHRRPLQYTCTKPASATAR